MQSVAEAQSDPLPFIILWDVFFVSQIEAKALSQFRAVLQMFRSGDLFGHAPWSNYALEASLKLILLFPGRVVQT